MHRLSAVTLAITLTSTTMVPLVAAAGTFACDKAGGSEAIVDACGARWTAATLRVHIAARNYGGDTKACLAKTAALLEVLAIKWVATGVYSSSYKLPCGKMPAVASADDGLLAKACPNKRLVIRKSRQRLRYQREPFAPGICGSGTFGSPTTRATPESGPQTLSGEGGSGSANFGPLKS